MVSTVTSSAVSMGSLVGTVKIIMAWLPVIIVMGIKRFDHKIKVKVRSER